MTPRPEPPEPPEPTEPPEATEPDEPTELDDDRKHQCGELATLASTPGGLAQVRRLHGRAASRAAASPGIQRDGTLRVAWLGESAAAGMFYRPHVTPAALLQRRLDELAGTALYAVEDLARPGLSARQLEESAAQALAARPSLLVVFAGNNWTWSGLQPDVGTEPAGGLAECDEAAAAVQEHGVAGLQALAERRQRVQAGRTLDTIAGLAAAAGVPLLWVVPEVNLADVSVPHPVYWLPGDGVRSWYRGRNRVAALLAKGELAAAAAGAQRLIELDGGACTASRRLLARALLRRGETRAALVACRAEVDAASWDSRFHRASGVNRAVLAALRDGCWRHGLARVELAPVFAATAGAVPGRGLFLDHCHPSLAGMNATAAAVASAVRQALPVSSTSGANRPDRPDRTAPAHREAKDCPPPLLALAHLQAGLYNANLNYGHWDWIEELLAGALEASDDLRATARDYLLARAAPLSPTLTKARRRNQASTARLDPLVWERRGLGGGLLELLCDLLQRFGLDPERDIVPAWTAQNPLTATGIDLATASDRPEYGTAWNDSKPRGLTFRAFEPTSTFRFLADGLETLAIELAARLPSPAAVPRTGRVVIEVNGCRLATCALAGAWCRRAWIAPPEILRPGINRISLRWPLPVHAGDASLAEIASRLRLGIPVDLYPVFGELSSLRVRPVAGPS